ncbi:MAG: zinc carboxypeptidase, partial [Thermoplasmata archaeon]|nr:zinc carboxypeptidase [Thermoplasmata archaeon]
MKKSIENIYRKIRIFAVIIILILSTLIFMANNVSAKVDYDLSVSSDFKPLKQPGFYNHTDTCDILYSIEENYTSIAKVYNLGEMFPNNDSTNKTTWEGRNMLAIKISDNPELNETDEPNVLYMGTHHAREVIANEILLYFLNSIVENYTVNQTITDMINTRELWIVPIVNPDGVEYFHETEWWWRKNRRDNGDGTFGVDLNRNYGWMWGLNDGGSSPNTNSPTYRGPGPFSEPETQIIRDFGHEYAFELMLTFHSAGELILYPWGYQDEDTPDEYLFEAIGHEMAKYNGYTVQQGIDLYPVNGETTDWFYENFTTLGYTIEACISSEQVPPQNKIIPICQENYEPCIVIAQLAD